MQFFHALEELQGFNRQLQAAHHAPSRFRHGAVSGRLCAQPTFEGSRSTTRTWRAGAQSQPNAEFRATLCARPRTLRPLIESHRHPLIELARRRGVGNLRVFGSMAWGDADADSDVDLLVTLPPGASALALGGLLMDAQELLGRRVDVVTEPALHPALRERILASCIAL